MVLEAVAKLPDNVSLDEVHEEMDILAALRRARLASAETRVCTQEKAKQRAAHWALK